MGRKDIKPEIKKAWTVCIKHPKEWSICCLLEITFMILFSLVLVNSFEPIANEVKLLSESTGNSLEEMLESSDVITAHASEISNLVLKFFFNVVLLWLVLQGLIWYYCHKMIGKIDLRTFFIKFGYVTIAFILLLFLMIWLVSMLMAASVGGLAIMDVETVSGINFIFTLILFLLCNLAYANLKSEKVFVSLKDAFKKKWARLLLAMLFFLMAIYLANTIMMMLMIVPVLSLIFGILVVIPLMSFLRVFLIESVKN